MRLLVMSALLCLIWAGSDRAASQSAASDPQRAIDAAGEKRDHDAAVANCVGMWDSATHMTKQQWWRACRRIQERLRTLSVR
jgi:hypothetical protein